MKPTYERGPVTLYLADCRDVLPTLAGIDAVVTDPPYGVGIRYATYEDSLDNWYALMNEVVPLMRRVAGVVVMPSCAINRMEWWYANHKPDWLIAWYKGSPGHQAYVGFNDWEPHLVWGKPKRAMHDHFQTVCGAPSNHHPCPKPVEWAEWLVRRLACRGELIVDPFLGYGATALACIETGRQFAGVEVAPEYFAATVRRIDAALDQKRLPFAVEEAECPTR